MFVLYPNKTMFSATTFSLRRRTPWRELLHPLPMRARQYQWWRRDGVEATEEILRRPFYKLKPATSNNAVNNELRNKLQTPQVAGPLPLPLEGENSQIIPRDVRMLKPNFSQSWETIPVTRGHGQR